MGVTIAPCVPRPNAIGAAQLGFATAEDFDDPSQADALAVKVKDAWTIDLEFLPKG